MPENSKTISVNRQARFNYFVYDKYEAGIELKGYEVKSLREGRVALRDSFVRFFNGEAYVFNMHVTPYEHAGRHQAIDPTRMRKLLLKKSEIRKLIGDTSRKGYACIPLRIYFKKGRAKLEIALCKGKKAYDKRAAIKRREHEREIDRALHKRKK